MGQHAVPRCSSGAAAALCAAILSVQAAVLHCGEARPALLDWPYCSQNYEWDKYRRGSVFTVAGAERVLFSPQMSPTRFEEKQNQPTPALLCGAETALLPVPSPSTERRRALLALLPTAGALPPAAQQQPLLSHSSLTPPNTPKHRLASALSHCRSSLAVTSCC